MAETVSARPTADHLEQGIANALEAHDVKAAVAILEVLAKVDIKRATRVYDTLQLGIALGRMGDRGGGPGLRAGETG